MNTEVTHLQPVHPWSKNPDTPSLNATYSNSSAWILPSLFQAPSSSFTCEKMYPSDSLSSPDLQCAEAQLDFFHKLGYSTAQVQAVQQKFGPGMDRDKVLGELVRIGASREERQGPVTTVSVVVARGDTQATAPTLLMPFTASPPQSREESAEDEDALRPIVIDGSNVAMSHGNKEVFSCLGIQLTVNFFLERGHTKITVFVPSWRKEQPRPDVPITDQHILRDLESKKLLVFTPSRYYGGKRVVCNDDNFIVKEAFESDGIMVSNDMYRDLQREKPEWKRFIEERLLMYSFVNNKFMPPDDPLGRHGPNLENFLRKFPKTQKKKPCPYGKKCTYGIKCKFSHPERAKQSNRSVAEELRDRDHTKHPSTAQKQPSARSSPVPGLSLSLMEDMAKKLTIGHDASLVKKDHQKSSHRSSKRSTPRKEKTGQRLSPDHSSQEQLDSGLGSIDSQCDKYGPAYGSCPHPQSVRQQYGPPISAPCSCCSQGPSSWGAAPAIQHYSIGPVSSDMTVYGQPRYASYSGYPVSMSPYSQPADFQHSRPHGQQQQRYWSDPFGAHPPPPPPHHWDQPQGKQTNPRGGGGEEREVVRKKLLAIFSAHLVDTAMDMFPQVMDPQKLVAEIVMLQSQNSSLR